MDKLLEHAVRMLKIVDGKNDFFRNDNEIQADIARAVYDTILQVQVLKMAERKPNEPKQGEWIHPTEYGLNLPEHYCSKCGKWEYSDIENDFCPNCGADMRSEETIAEADRMKQNEDDLIERITDRLIEKLSFSPVVILCDELPETGKPGHIYVIGIKQYMWQKDAWERIN